MFQFVATLFFAVITITSASLLWPRFTANPRPPLLQQVRDTVISTPPGQQAAMVLGVSDEAAIEPFSVNMVRDGITKVVEERVQKVVVGNAVNELSRQFDTLPLSQRQQIQEVLCRPLQ